MEQFKIRCSAMSEIMGALKGGLTETQAKNLATLEAKEKRTAKQEETRKELLAKRDMPKELPKTCITYLEKWVKERLYDWREELDTDPINKGKECEDEAIAMTIDRFGLSYNEKCNQSFENDWITGSPDLMYEDEVFDTKVSFTPKSFPLFVTEPMKKYNYNYWCQGQGYQALTGRRKYSVVYALVNTPKAIVDKEVYHKTRHLSSVEAEEMELKIRINHNYDQVNLKDKIKRFEFSYDEYFIEAVYRRVELCREYIKNNLLTKLTTEK